MDCLRQRLDGFQVQHEFVHKQLNLVLSSLENLECLFLAILHSFSIVFLLYFLLTRLTLDLEKRLNEFLKDVIHGFKIITCSIWYSLVENDGMNRAKPYLAQPLHGNNGITFPHAVGLL